MDIEVLLLTCCYKVVRKKNSKVNSPVMKGSTKKSEINILREKITEFIIF